MDQRHAAAGFIPVFFRGRARTAPTSECRATIMAMAGALHGLRTAAFSTIALPQGLTENHGASVKNLSGGRKRRNAGPVLTSRILQQQSLQIMNRLRMQKAMQLSPATAHFSCMATAWDGFGFPPD